MNLFSIALALSLGCLSLHGDETTPSPCGKSFIVTGGITHSKRPRVKVGDGTYVMTYRASDGKVARLFVATSHDLAPGKSKDLHLRGSITANLSSLHLQNISEILAFGGPPALCVFKKTLR